MKGDSTKAEKLVKLLKNIDSKFTLPKFATKQEAFDSITKIGTTKSKLQKDNYFNLFFTSCTCKFTWNGHSTDIIMCDRCKKLHELYNRTYNWGTPKQIKEKRKLYENTVKKEDIWKEKK